MIATVLIAMLSVGAIGAYRYAAIWTPLQCLYFAAHLRSDAMRAIGFTTSAHYRLLQVVDRKGTRLALDDEVRPMTTATGASSFALTEAALALGDRRLVWHDGSYNHAALHTFLRHWIYCDQALTDLLIPAVWGGVGVCLAGLLLSIPRDLARSRERRHGRQDDGMPAGRQQLEANSASGEIEQGPTATLAFTAAPATWNL